MRPTMELKKISGVNPTTDINPTVVPVRLPQIFVSSNNAKYTPRKTNTAKKVTNRFIKMIFETKITKDAN